MDGVTQIGQRRTAGVMTLPWRSCWAAVLDWHRLGGGRATSGWLIALALVSEAVQLAHHPSARPLSGSGVSKQNHRRSSDPSDGMQDAHTFLGKGGITSPGPRSRQSSEPQELTKG